MARWLYLLTIPSPRIEVLKNDLISNEFEPIISIRHDASPIAYSNAEITISVNVDGNVRKRIAEGFFALHCGTIHGKPLREFEEPKWNLDKFLRFFVKYKKRRWMESLAIYGSTILAVGGYDLAKMIHDNFPISDTKDFNFTELFLLSAFPPIIHLMYGYARMPRESEVKLDDQS